jgi:hypothetical protein
MKRFKVILIAVGMLVGAAAAQATIRCEKCTCNMNTGICECTDCTITENPSVN